MTEAMNTVEGADLAPEPAAPERPDLCAGCGTDLRTRGIPDGGLCNTCAQPAGWFDDRAKCDGCGKTKDRVIRRRFGTPDRRRLCDDCHDERTTR